MKNFDDVNTKLIVDKFLLRLNIHILAKEFLEKRSFWFIKVNRNNKKTNKYNKKIEIVSDSKEKTKKKDLTQKKETRGLYCLQSFICLYLWFLCLCLQCPLFYRFLRLCLGCPLLYLRLLFLYLNCPLFCLRLYLLYLCLYLNQLLYLLLFCLCLYLDLVFCFLSTVSIFMLGLTTFLFLSAVFILVLGFAFLSTSAIFMLMLRLSTLPSISTILVLTLRLCALLFLFTIFVPKLGLSLPSFYIVFSANINTCFKKTKTRSVKQNNLKNIFRRSFSSFCPFILVK